MKLRVCTRRVLAVVVCCSMAHAQNGAFEVGSIRMTAAEEASTVKTNTARRTARASGEPARVRLAPLNGEQLREKITASGNSVVGHVREISSAQMEVGQWDFLSDNRHIWRLSIVSPGAIALRLHFADFDVGSGQVHVYSPDAPQSERLQTYTNKGVFGSAEFWSAVTPGDTVVVEFEPAGNDADPEVGFRIDALDHVGSALQGAASGVGLVETPAHETLANEGKEGEPQACHMDVGCAPSQWRQMGQAVALFIAHEGKHMFICSGTLMNNYKADFRPYFLTANHCISDAAKARTALVLWQFESQQCGGEAPDVRNAPQQFVDRLLITRPIEEGDVSLLLLAGQPPPQALFSGWTSRELPMGGIVGGIHHPLGTHKRFSLGSRVGDRSVTVVDDKGKELAHAPAELYYHISWVTGITESGSSGSGLFDEQGHLVGVLSHGNCTCDGRGSSGYGRLSRAFLHLRGYLVDGGL